jgi:hypothetical protein
MNLQGIYEITVNKPELHKINAHNRMLKISNIDTILLGDQMYIRNFLEKYGTIIAFRTVSYSTKISWLVEFNHENTISTFITSGLFTLLQNYPYLHIGYFS